MRTLLLTEIDRLVYRLRRWWHTRWGWPRELATQRRRWEEVDNAIAMMPDSLLFEALDNPYMSSLDRERVQARLAQQRRSS